MHVGYMAYDVGSDQRICRPVFPDNVGSRLDAEEANDGVNAVTARHCRDVGRGLDSEVPDAVLVEFSSMMPSLLPISTTNESLPLRWCLHTSPPSP